MGCYSIKNSRTTWLLLTATVCLMTVVKCQNHQQLFKRPPSNHTVKNCPSMCFCVKKRVYCDRLLLRFPPKSYPNHTEFITLKNNKIRRINRRIFRNLPELKSLLISDNDLVYIYGGSFKHLKSLVSLSLKTNRLVSLPSRTFRGLHNLQFLALMHNKLVHVHKLFKFLPSLKLLNLADNNIRRIRDSTFKRNPNLQFLDMRNNSIVYISKLAFANQHYLKMLILRENLLNRVELQFSPGLHIHYLDFSKCRIRSMVKGLPSKIQELRMSENYLTSLDEYFFRDTRVISVLDLNFNKIRQIENDTFTKLDVLHNLHLKENRLDRIPKVPKSIQGIYMNLNKVQRIDDDALVGLNNLEYLMLRGNNIVYIDPMAFKDLQNMKGLYLNNNSLHDISPMMFHSMKELEALDLSNNPVRILAPFSFHGLKNLMILRLSSLGPQFTDTRIFEDLQNLKFLDFSRSPNLVKQFTSKPRSLEYFKSVEDLNFMEDEIHQLPSDFPSNFPELRVAKLSGNPWHCDKSILWLSKWMKQNVVDFFAKDHIQCASPPPLVGQKIADLTAKVIEKHTGFIPPSLPKINISITLRRGDNTTLGMPVAYTSSTNEKQVEINRKTEVSNQINNKRNKNLPPAPSAKTRYDSLNQIPIMGNTQTVSPKPRHLRHTRKKLKKLYKKRRNHTTIFIPALQKFKIFRRKKFRYTTPEPTTQPVIPSTSVKTTQISKLDKLAKKSKKSKKKHVNSVEYLYSSNFLDYSGDGPPAQ